MGVLDPVPALRQVVATVTTTAGTAVINRHNPVDASGGARAIALPTGAYAGAEVGVEKIDASLNTVTITGTVRGIASSSIALSWQYQSLRLRADATGAWWPISGHVTRSALDATYGAKADVAAVIAALPAKADLASGKVPLGQLDLPGIAGSSALSGAFASPAQVDARVQSVEFSATALAGRVTTAEQNITTNASAIAAKTPAAFAADVAFVTVYGQRELAYAECTTQQTTSADAFSASVAIPGLSVSFTLTDTARVEVLLDAPSVRHTTAGQGVGFVIKDGAGVEQQRSFVKSATANNDTYLQCRLRKTLPAGSYTYVGYFGVYGSGATAQINAGATFPARLMVTKV